MIANRAASIEQLRATQQMLEKLLVQFESSEQDRFASHVQSRRESRLMGQSVGKGGKQIERCVFSTFHIAESMRVKGEFRQWDHLLRVGDEIPGTEAQRWCPVSKKPICISPLRIARNTG
jgi:hypothetical protein